MKKRLTLFTLWILIGLSCLIPSADAKQTCKVENCEQCLKFGLGVIDPMVCVRCQSGYSPFQTGKNHIICVKCPKNANCPQDGQISCKEGYYQATNAATGTPECYKNDEGCKKQDGVECAECEEGYFRVMDAYKRVGDRPAYTCSKTPQYTAYPENPTLFKGYAKNLCYNQKNHKAQPVNLIPGCLQRDPDNPDKCSVCAAGTVLTQWTSLKGVRKECLFCDNDGNCRHPWPELYSTFEGPKICKSVADKISEGSSVQLETPENDVYACTKADGDVYPCQSGCTKCNITLSENINLTWFSGIDSTCSACAKGYELDNYGKCYKKDAKSCIDGSVFDESIGCCIFDGNKKLENGNTKLKDLVNSSFQCYNETINDYTTVPYMEGCLDRDPYNPYNCTSCGNGMVLYKGVCLSCPGIQFINQKLNSAKYHYPNGETSNDGLCSSPLIEEKVKTPCRLFQNLDKWIKEQETESFYLSSVGQVNGEVVRHKNDYSTNGGFLPHENGTYACAKGSDGYFYPCGTGLLSCTIHLSESGSYPLGTGSTKSGSGINGEPNKHCAERIRPHYLNLSLYSIDNDHFNGCRRLYPDDIVYDEDYTKMNNYTKYRGEKDYVNDAGAGCRIGKRKKKTAITAPSELPTYRTNIVSLSEDSLSCAVTKTSGCKPCNAGDSYTTDCQSCEETSSSNFTFITDLGDGDQKSAIVIDNSRTQKVTDGKIYELENNKTVTGLITPEQLHLVKKNMPEGCYLTSDGMYHVRVIPDPTENVVEGPLTIHQMNLFCRNQKLSSLEPSAPPLSSATLTASATIKTSSVMANAIAYIGTGYTHYVQLMHADREDLEPRFKAGGITGCVKSVNKECETCDIDYMYLYTIGYSNGKKITTCQFNPHCYVLLGENAKCFLCEAGYYLNDSGKCEPCKQDNCAKCDARSCEVCKKGFFNNGRSCTKCLEGCTECDNAKTCKTCDKDHSLYTGGEYPYCKKTTETPTGCKELNRDKCTSCQEGYYVSNKDPKSGVVCTRCNLNGCLECKSDGTRNGTTCTKCEEGYKLENGRCLNCNLHTENCIACSFNSNDMASCDICDISKGYTRYLYQNGSNSYNKCKKDPHCSRARVDTTECIKCDPSYHLENGECVKVQNCMEYNMNGICNICKPGYAKKGDYLCEKVTCNNYLEGCEICNEPTKCYQCKAGYQLVDSKCYEQKLNCKKEHCLKCNAEGSLCFECTSGYHIENGSCVENASVSSLSYYILYTDELPYRP